MMKVILDTSVVLGEGQSSFRYFSELIPRLRREPGLNIEVLPSPYFNLPQDWFSDKPAYRPLSVKANWIPQGKIRALLSSAKRTFEKHRQKQTIFKNPSETLFHSFFYTLPSDDSVRVISMALDTVVEKLGEELGTLDSFGPHLIQKKKAFQKAERIISISQSTTQDLSDIYEISKSKIDTIYLGVQLDFWKDRIGKTLSIKRPYLLQVGGRMHHRNFMRLAEAFSLSPIHKDYLLVCAGEPWSEEETAFIKKLGIENRVKLFQNPSNEILRSLYQQAKMLVYPSLYEGFGFPLIEAMACGTPVATSKDAGSIPEVAADAALYFDPRDPSDIARTIEELLNPATAQGLVEKGFENIKRFSWDQTTEKTLQCYRKVFSA